MACLVHENLAVMITHGNVICSITQGIVVAQVAEPFSVFSVQYSFPRTLTSRIQGNSETEERLAPYDYLPSADVPLLRATRLHLEGDPLPRHLRHPREMEHNAIPQGHCQACRVHFDLHHSLTRVPGIARRTWGSSPPWSTRW
jgi:hypothetical protein